MYIRIALNVESIMGLWIRCAVSAVSTLRELWENLENKMAILESIRTFATGRDESERKSYAMRNKLIRAKATAAGFREKEKQEIRLAVAKQRKSYDNKIKNLGNKKTGFSSVDIFRIAKQQSSSNKNFRII